MIMIMTMTMTMMLMVMLMIIMIMMMVIIMMMPRTMIIPARVILFMVCPEISDMIKVNAKLNGMPMLTQKAVFKFKAKKSVKIMRIKPLSPLDKINDNLFRTS